MVEEKVILPRHIKNKKQTYISAGCIITNNVHVQQF